MRTLGKPQTSLLGKLLNGENKNIRKHGCLPVGIKWNLCPQFYLQILHFCINFVINDYIVIWKKDK